MSKNNSPDNNGGPTTSKRWNTFYEEDNTPWDLGCANPALIAVLELARSMGLPWPSSDEHPKALLPGCGRGHDGIPLLEKGFSITGVDFAPKAAAQTQTAWASFGEKAQVLQSDVTKLPSELNQTFDVVVEHTCFVALPPNLREAYVESMAKILKPGGFLLGIFFHHERGSGPPYGMPVAHLLAVFEKYFDVLHQGEAENSLEKRAMMKEWSWIFRLKIPAKS